MKRFFITTVLVLTAALFALCGCGETPLPDNPDNPGSSGGTDGGSGGKTTCTVTFVIDGETVETQELNPGETIADPKCDTSKEGHTFEGWQRPDGKLVKWNYVSERKVTEDITLTAYYSVNSYKIGFYYMGEQIGATKKLGYGSEFAFPTDFAVGSAVEVTGWRERGSEEIISSSVATVKRDAAYDAVVKLKPYKSINYDGFPSECYYLYGYDCENASVTLVYDDGSEYSLKKSEYEVIVPDDFATECKQYKITVNIKLEEGLERTFNVNVKENKSKISVLFIGNSYSDDTIDLSYNVAKGLGLDSVDIATLYHPGCTIDMHLNFLKSNPRNYIFRYFERNGELNTAEDNMNTAKLSTMEEGIKFKPWDFIILQQGSSMSGVPGSYGNIGALIDYVRSKAINPNVRFAFNMTWAYMDGRVRDEFAKYDYSQKKMYDSIISSVKSQVEPNKTFVAIIPNGTAVQNARTSVVGDNLTRDGADHLTYGLGRYIAALTFVSKMTGVSEADIRSLAYAPSGLSATQIAIAKESAINALKTPFAVTQSTYAPPGIVADASSIEGKTEKELTFSRGYYYSSNQNGDYYGLISSGGISGNYYATAKFTKADLPVGSVIYVASGWQYRPEGWINGGKNLEADRPANTSAQYIVINEAWWGNYTERAFNISKLKTTDITGEADVIPTVFKIYLPNSD